MYRVLLKFGPITVYSYGFMLAVAFIAGTFLAQRRAAKRGISPQEITDLIFYIMVSSILGARIFFVLLNLKYYLKYPLDIFKVWEGGLIFYGGFILGFFVAFWFLKKNKLSFWKVGDIISPSIALGIAIGRIGCFLNGCCYGRISEKWGISFPASENSPAFAQHLNQGLIPSNATCSLPVIPTQLYDSLSVLMIFFVILALEKQKKFEGASLLLFVLFYSVSRFIIESFRYYDSNFVLFGMITVSQFISIIVFFIAAVFWKNKSRKIN